MYFLNQMMISGLLSCLLRFRPQQPPCLSLFPWMPTSAVDSASSPPRSPHCDRPPSVQVPRTWGSGALSMAKPSISHHVTQLFLLQPLPRRPTSSHSCFTFTHSSSRGLRGFTAPSCCARPPALHGLLPCTPCALPLPRSLCMCCFPRPGARASPPVPSALTISLTLELSASSRKPVLGPQGRLHFHRIGSYSSVCLSRDWVSLVLAPCSGSGCGSCRIRKC